MAPEASHLLTRSVVAPPAEVALAALPPPLRAWFTQRFAAPTPAQRHTWPRIARGDNVLLSAPTGTGKSLAAFLPILGHWQTRPEPGLACVYVSPLKALAADLLRNLRRVV